MSDQSLLDQLSNDGNDNRQIDSQTPAEAAEPVEVNRVIMEPPQNQPEPQMVDIGVGKVVSEPPEYQDTPRRQTPERIVSKRAESVQRVKADLSSLPEPENENDAESITKEIFKEGGDFDKMIERRTQEMKEVMADPAFTAQAENAMAMLEEAAKRQNGEATAPMADNVTGDDFDDFYDDEPQQNQEPIDTSNAAKIDFENDEDELALTEEPKSSVKIVEMPAPAVEVPKAEVEEDLPTKEPEPVNIEEPVADTATEVKVQDTSIVDDDLEVVTEEYQPTAADYIIESTDEDDEAANEARLQYFKEEITKKLKPVSARLDISGFTVINSPTKNNTNIVTSRSAQLAKWPLINSGIVVTVKEIPGATLELIRSHINNNDARAVLSLIYDYVVGPKPLTFEAWAESIDAEDYDHLFMAFYIACFKGSNFLPIDCTNDKCPKKVFLTDDIRFGTMVKFGNQEIKKKFNTIYAEEPTNPNGTTVRYRVPISNEIAIDFARPSLYREYVEMGYLDDGFIRRYAGTLDYIRYIGGMYIIHEDKKGLEAVQYEKVQNNPGRTARNKIIAYSNYIKSFTVDELGVMRAYINQLADDTADITYIRPATKCPHCGAEVPEMEMTATSMVFLRNQLGLLTTT